jgi:hypothetical protein
VSLALSAAGGAPTAERTDEPGSEAPLALEVVPEPASIRPGPLAVRSLLWAGALIAGASVGRVGAAAVVVPVALVAELSGLRAALRPITAPAPALSALPASPALSTLSALSALSALSTSPAARPALRVPPVVVVAVVVAALSPVAAIGDPVAAGALLVAAAALAALVAGRLVGVDPVRVLIAAAGPGLAGVGLVATSREGVDIAVVLVLAVLGWDLANSVMGVGPTGGILGALAGAVTVGVLAVVMEAVLDPPVSGSSWAVLPALAVVAAPLGVQAIARAAPGRVPALRRLDSLALAAPAWAIGAAALLHR